jgi:hypothetical protein
MYKLLLAAAAASLALAAPAVAAPGNSNGQGKQAKPGQTANQGQGKPQAKQLKHIYQGQTTASYWGNSSCPPGLAKKNNGCLPPGIAKQRFNAGDRWSGSYDPWNYNQIPRDWRNQYDLDARNGYYYRDGYLYGVDPKTRIVVSVIQALIR